MSLTIYDNEKKCQVLDPSNFVINAFHKDYVKTYMPDFLSEIRTDSRQTKAGRALSTYIDKLRETKPTHGTVFGLSEKSVSVVPMQMMDTKPREYHTYAKAGIGNVKPKRKKK